MEQVINTKIRQYLESLGTVEELTAWLKQALTDRPQQVIEEAHQAITASGGRRHILGTGCVAFTTVPYGNLMAARRAVETYPL